MDLHLKEWRNQDESEQQQQQPAAKIPKLLLDQLHHHHQQHQHASSEQSALPLFVSSDQPNTKMLSPPLSDSNTRMGSYFSLAQWQELELQALIYRYMLAGAAVPPELLQPIRKSLLYSSSYFLHHPLQHHYSHYQTPLLQSGYWGRAAMDPEPGRCRRTDGKKWRCSRDVVTGQKYCERHVHRGRNRSRKPVEMPPTSTTSVTVANNNTAARFAGGSSGSGGGAVKANSPMIASSFAAVANSPKNFGLSRPSPPIDLLQLNHSSSDSKNEHKGLYEAQTEVDNRSDGRILRHFFDDWPRTLQDPDNNRPNASPMSSATCLSISIPGNSSSDVSLKLSTGNGDQLGPSDSGRDHHHQTPLNWGMGGWSASGSMGGPLAEALRSSSTSNSSPTSVLHQLPRGSTSEISYVST